MTTIITRRPIDPQRPLSYLALLGILIGYGLIGALYVTRTPAWQVPDEPAHFNYVAQVMWAGLPTLDAGDWDSAYLESLKSNRFSLDSQEGRLYSIQYEDHQPPLYYLLAAPIFFVSNSSLIALRFFSLVLGAFGVLTAFGVVRRLFPAQPYLAVGTAAFVAFLPQHIAMLSGVNNDSLAELMVGLTLFACIGWLRARDTRLIGHALWLGVLLGLAFLTKATAYSLIVVVGAAVLLRARRDHWPIPRAVRLLVIIAIPALLLGGLWWVRNVNTYGFPDILGLRRHDEVVIGQQRTADAIAAKGLPAYLSEGVQTTFESFWGRFGWMGVVLPRNVVLALVIFNSFALMGAGVAFIQFRTLLDAVQAEGIALLALTALLALGLFVYYNLGFQQFQGRYLFTAIIPFGLYYTAGLVGWASLARPIAARWVLIGSGAVGLAGFALYAILRLIVPALSG